jgi:hypothetical protein
MLVRLVELVADERRHARLNAARAERDERESRVKAVAVVVEQSQAEMAQAVNQAQPENRVVFAKESVRQPAAQQREKVDANNKGMEDIFRRASPIRLRQIGEQRRDQERRQDIAHPVKAEPLAPLVADDVTDLPGNRRLRIRCGRHLSRQRRINDILLHRRERRLHRAAAQP